MSSRRTGQVRARPPVVSPARPAAAGCRSRAGHWPGGPSLAPTRRTAGDHRPDGSRGVADAAARIAELEDLRLRALADLDNAQAVREPGQPARGGDQGAGGRGSGCRWSTTSSARWQHAQADPGSIIEGIRAVRDQAIGVLAQLGFPRRDDLGARFDPARHEAVASRADTGAPDGSVVEVVRPAYGEGDRQLRPAQVVVAKAD